MKVSGLRWWIVGLIALATVINYIDRQSLNVLWPEIASELYPDKTPFERKEIYALFPSFLFFPMLLVKPFSGKYSIGLARV